MYDLNGKELCGERVIVEHTKGPRRDGGYGGGRSRCPAISFISYNLIINEGFQSLQRITNVDCYNTNLDLVLGG